MKIQGIILPPSRNGNIPHELCKDRYFLPFLGDSKIVDLLLSNLVNADTFHIGIKGNVDYIKLSEHISTGKDWNMFDKIMTLFPSKPNTVSSPSFIGIINEIKEISDFILTRDTQYYVFLSSDYIWNESLVPILKETEEKRLSCVVGRGINKNEILYFICDKPMIEKLITTETCEQAEDITEIYKAENKFKEIMIQKPYFPIYELNDYYNSIMLFCDDDAIRDSYLFDNKLMCKKNFNKPIYTDFFANVNKSILSSGNEIYGRVYHSVICPNVKIEKYANVNNCIIFENSTIGEKCDLRNVIIPEGKNIPNGTVIIGDIDEPVIA